MPLIEGVGDEVTNFMMVMMVVIIGIISWWSTSITEQPLIRTVLILEPHNRHRTVGAVRATAVIATTAVEDTGQSETSISERNHSESVSEAAIESHESSEAKLQNSANKPPSEQDLDPGPGSSTQPAQASTSTSQLSEQETELVSSHCRAAAQSEKSPKAHDSGKNEIRRRRLQFFQDKQEVPQLNAGEEDTPAKATSGDNHQLENAKHSDSVETLPEEVESSECNNKTLPGSEKIKESLSSANFTNSLEPPESQESPCESSTQENCNEVVSLEQSSLTECVNNAEITSCSCPESCSHALGNANDENILKPGEALPTVDGIRIRLKYLNDDQKLVQGKLQEPLGDFKRRHFSLELEGNKLVRLIFNGQVLNSDDQTLQNYGLFDNCVVHCLVHSRRTTTASADAAPNNNNVEDVSNGGNAGAAPRDWDMSQLLYIGLSGILTMAWVLRFSNPLIFSATSTIALFGLTGVYVISIVGMYIPDPEGLRT